MKRAAGALKQEQSTDAGSVFYGSRQLVIPVVRSSFS